MRLTRIVPVVALLLVVLSGCTLAAAGSGEQTETAQSEQPKQAVTIDPADVLDVLGPVPPDPELTDALLEDYLQRSRDWQWANVLNSFPDAQRPEVAEVERAAGSNPRWEGCVGEARATGLDPQAFAIAAYTCAVEYPSLPNGTLSPDQAGYLYDYLVRFVMPCYAAAGFPDKSTPPTRDFFAANWPFQNWSPRPMGEATLGGQNFDTVHANCPGFPDSLQR